MEGPALTLAALADRGAMASLSPALQALSVVLHPAERVHIPVVPKSGGEPQEAYAGLLVFSVPKDGAYRISSNSPILFKVVGSRGTVGSHAFEIRSGCGKIFKSFTFQLQAGATYWLELAANIREAKVVISPE